MNVMEWILQWFNKKTGTSIEELFLHRNDNYFELGYLDSFEFIGFIGEIEAEFKMAFDNDQFEDRTFFTISGLSKIIEGCKK